MEIGTHCGIEDCKTLDFLPFNCNHCSTTYCLNHRLPQNHKCPNWNDQQNITDLPEIVSTKKECEAANCGAKEKITSQCTSCGKSFCLKHRHAPDHNCDGVKRQEEAAAQNRENIKEYLNQRFPSTSASHSAAPSAKRPTKVNPKIELMKMRSKAKGDANVSQENRVYIRVYLPQPESKEDSMPLFFHKDWSVGRLVDKIASIANLENVNNKAVAEKMLSLHQYETGDVLAMSSTLNELVSANILDNGSSIILRRGGVHCSEH
ncbi:hypothetical protein BC829DRAFT_381545 [Chytridium lagenaria]|nr:hypothetical protein BC829DRAFT_381545 [Chytridium lagenaria]